MNGLCCALMASLVVQCIAAVEPPRLDIPPGPRPTNASVAGTTVALDDAGVKFTLFVPHAWTNTAPTNVTLTVHFHTTASFTIPEHLRRGATNPLAVFALGSGSSAYRAPFEDTNRFARILSSIEAELGKRAGAPAPITGIELSSFSAGYGAVREIVKDPRYFSRIVAVVLLDSFYGSLGRQPDGNTNRVVQAEHAEVWLPLARAAIQGEKTFVISVSQVPTPTYASTLEVATALLDRLGLKFSPVAQAAAEGKITLLNRSDSGRLHVWSYSGTNGPAHTAHVQHMADVWKALPRN